MGIFRARSFIFAINAYLATALALYVSFALDLPNPWWAMVTVFLAQPTQLLVGAIWAKAAYRVVGTLIGAAGSLLIIPNLSQAPELMILALAGWIGLCLYGALLDRTPRAYVFMLAGYTVALVGLPQATNPTALFDVSVARAEEIVIGVLASAVVQSILFPRSVTAFMQGKLNEILADARTSIRDVLAEPASLGPALEHQHIATGLTDLSLMATNLRFEEDFPASARRVLRALEERLVSLLPLTSAVQDRFAALREIGPIPPIVEEVVAAVATWLKSSQAADKAGYTQIVSEIERLHPRTDEAADWPNLLCASLSARLAELVGAWQECLVLTAALGNPTRIDPAVQALPGDRRPRTLHTDAGLALFSAIVVALTIIAISAFTIATKWENGATAIAITAVLCSIFIAADDPTPMAGTLIYGFFIAFPFAVFYEFAILQSIDGFAMLALVLFPVVFLAGFFFAQPKYATMALGSMVGFSAGLALQPEFLSSFAAFMNAYVALVIGGLFGFISLGTLRVLPAQKVAQRIRRAGWSDLAALSASPSDEPGWASLMIDRMGLLISRLARLPHGADLELMDALTDLRLGVTIIELNHLCSVVDRAEKERIESFMAMLGRHFKSLANGRPEILPQSAVDMLDAIMAGILRLPKTAERRAGLLAAVGLRRGLFPQAAAYQPMVSVK
ncbi:MAG: FUSC family protein [Methylovirgula sp.]|uniref:FUSC family protein n=1 Tax=Methylovirgula sp. TaxID=1978224 RepID=UPI0030765F7B